MPPEQPGQALLIKAQAFKGMNDPTYMDAATERESRIDYLLNSTYSYEADALAAWMQSSGWPIRMV